MAMAWLKDSVIPVASFLVGILGGLSKHIQEPLTDYRNTRRAISTTLMTKTFLIYYATWSQFPNPEQKGTNAELQDLANEIKNYRARLLTSGSSIPGFARPVLIALGLIRTRKQNKLAASRLVGIANTICSNDKKPELCQHLTRLINEVGAALNIDID
jgi:hypothetical protein